MPGKKADALDRTIGRNIRLHRVRRGLSCAELGRAIRVSGQQAQKYESGRNRISAARLYDVARLLDVPVAALFPDAGLRPKRYAIDVRAIFALMGREPHE